MTISVAPAEFFYVNTEYNNARWSEVLDGQKVWERDKVCPGDNDRFRTEYLDPIKQLQAEGKFEIVVITGNIRGASKVPLGVRITSAINYG